MTLSVSACVGSGPAPDLQIDGDNVTCIGWKPIYLQEEDFLTDETLDAIIAHNEFGVLKDCWPSPSE